MPTPMSDEMMKYMIANGYIVISEYQDPKLAGSETLYEFGRIPPPEDVEARQLFLELYRESSNWHLVEGKVYRGPHPKTKGRHYKRKRR